MRLIFLLTFLPFTAFSQFNWDKTNSTPLGKNELYSATKLFIAHNWTSSNVIQDDDKEGGIILLKGLKIHHITYVLSLYTYSYSYTVTFKFKDSKYRIIINDVYCKSAPTDLVQPFEGDNCPHTGTFTSPLPPCKKLMDMMTDIKAELERISIKYEEYINSTKPNSVDW